MIFFLFNFFYISNKHSGNRYFFSFLCSSLLCGAGEPSLRLLVHQKQKLHCGKDCSGQSRSSSGMERRSEGSTGGGVGGVV